MSPKVDLKLDWATHEAAKYACKMWHYSKTLPVNKLVKIGVWENQKFIGVIIFSCGSSGVSSYSKTLGITRMEIAELSRVALNDHKSPVTRILKIAIKKLKEKSPKLRVLVSYADREQGHHGGIYQAGNWIYSGLSANDVAYFDKKGKRYHSRSVSESGFKIQCGVMAKCKKPSELIKRKIPGKHRYLLALDEKMRLKIEGLKKPYPKRVVSKDNVASDLRSEEGGVTPTTTLHLGATR